MAVIKIDLLPTVILPVVILSADAVAFSSAHFGTGAGPIYLDNVGCNGSESNLIDCPHSSFVNCYSSSANAGVRCQGIDLYRD